MSQQFEECLRTTLASLGDAVVSTDLEGRIVFANSVALSMLRAVENEVTGKPFDEIVRLRDELTGAQVESPLRRVLSEGAVAGLGNHTILIARDGTEVPIDNNAAPIRNDSGTIFGTVMVFRDISERRRAEAATRLLASIVESSGDCIISENLDGIITSWNRSAERIFGYTPQEAIGRHVSILSLPDRGEEMPAILARVRNGERIEHYETERRAKDGRIVNISLTVSPVRDAEGRIVGASKIARDITEEVRIRERLNLLAAIVESSDDAIISKNIEGIITSWNKGAERIFGYSAMEAIGKPISIIAPPDRRVEMTQILQRIKRGERVEHFETVRQGKDGPLKNISMTASPVRDKAGRITGASKIARDITEAVRVRSELAEQRERLRVTLSSIGDGVITTDEAGVVTYLNPVAEDLTGWTNAEGAGKPLHEIFRIVNEESRRPMENPAARVIADGHVVGLANHTVLIAREGRERAIDDSAAPIRNDRGETVGVVLVFRDVTERRATEKEIEAKARELRRANDELSQFAYAVSHDLREPLRNIAVFSEMLVREHRDTEGDSPIRANYILNAVGRLETLLNDLLAYSQAGSSEGQTVDLVDIQEIVMRSIGDLQSAIAEAGARITAGALPKVYGYEGQLSQVFQNLIANAIKYRSDRPPEIHIHAEGMDSEWRFGVRDNGIGISAEYYKTIFGAFKRLHGKQIPGTGIGLAICAKVIERHGGRIWVESKPGEGSEFFFTLPATRENPRSEPRNPASTPRP